MKSEAIHGDSRDVLDLLYPDNHFDSVVTDPPYALVSIAKRFGADDAAPAQHGRDGVYARASAGFMGQKWDTGETAFDPTFWSEVLRVLKPGGHVLAFGGTRSYHRLVCAIEDAGFDIRDSVMWLYGTGFPKSHDVSKGIDKAAGATREVVGRKTGRAATPLNDMRGGRLIGSEPGTYDASAVTAPATEEAAQWEGWGTALKPAVEPIVLARKPLIGTMAENVLAHGTGALNIDGCRIETDGPRPGHVNAGRASAGIYSDGHHGSYAVADTLVGRWPANVIHDGSDEVLEAFAAFGERPGQLADASTGNTPKTSGRVYNDMGRAGARRGDTGTAARFFYSAKASKRERAGSNHPTVKPIALLRYLCRLITPPGGLILDPFAGSGTTLEAAHFEGFSCVGIEREAEYHADIQRRIAALLEVDPLS